MMKLFLAALIAVASSALLPAQPRGGSDRSISFTNVSVIDTVRGAVRPHMTVVVSGQRIAQVGEDGRTKIPGGSRIIDASGKFLIPGLWDMHVHTFFGDLGRDATSVTLPLLIAHGVTGVRDMGSDLAPIVQARKDIAEGRLLGPHMVIAGPMLDGPATHYPASIRVTSADDGRRAVQTLESSGVDFIKIQSGVPRDAYFAIVDECRKRRIPFDGHVPDGVRGAEAANAGQRSFEHLIGIFEGSSTAEEEFLEGPKGPARFLTTYDAAKEAAMIRLLVERRTWQCPTLFWERGQWLVDAIDPRSDPAGRYAPAAWRDRSWPEWTASIMKTLDTDPLSVRQEFVQHELGIVKRLHQAGIPFLAGTDTPTGVDLIPGISLPLELERFVASGFTPFEALQTATINPARFLNRTADFGVVEKGRVADLVLLDADPTADIAGTRKIAAVVASGRYLSREDLDRLLKAVETSAAAR